MDQPDSTGAQYGRAVGEALKARASAQKDEMLFSFARAFWIGVSEEELQGRSFQNDLALTEDAWRALQEFNPANPVVDVIEGIADKSQSLVRILLQDMPFITDSVLIELSRDEVEVHYLHNITLNVQRDGSCHFGGLVASGGGLQETLIYAEIDARDETERLQLASRLRDVLANVSVAVRDYPLIRKRATDLAEALGTSEVASDHEAAAFLQWLVDDHFTFLGHRSFQITEGVMEQVPGSALGTLTLRSTASPRTVALMRDDTQDFLLEPTRLSFSKAGTPSRVHRPAYPDYVGVKQLDADGRVIGEEGFLGLYTSPVYTDHPRAIPVVRQKIANVMARSGYNPKGFDGKALAQVLATFPRDELFQMEEDALLKTSMAVAHLHSRRCSKLFVRRGRYGMFFNCLVYLPRDLLNTRVRLAIQELLVQTFHASDLEFNSYFSESVLVRLQFILRVDPSVEISFDREALEEQVISISRDWSADLSKALRDQDRSLVARFRDAFPADYRERFDIPTALYDAGHLNSLEGEGDLTVRFYRLPDADPEVLQLKLFRNGDLLSLSRVLPILENLGFDVAGEHPYRINGTSQQVIQDFTLRRTGGIDLSTVGDRFEMAFNQIWKGIAENDRFNGLVLAANLGWREVSLLRAYARYMKQAQFGFEQTYVAETLVAHPRAARLLMEHFNARLQPDEDWPEQDKALVSYLDRVDSLNQDRVLNCYLSLINATLRTNYFQKASVPDGDRPIVLKFDSQSLTNLPAPRPAFEIFMYAPDMEGVHLRSSAVARGGIRWSDRLEDFRTEVLGLVKAQVVKNSVIVPSGAKGGFIIKRSVAGLSRDDFQAAGKRVYRKFIRGLLSVTDNLVDNQIVHPEDVRRRDNDDIYLVVAADKGTATFSDIANEIAVAQGFWLGDAFASGGSVGYDHKKLGITARGAWVSVRRHFHDLGIDPELDPIATVGIGDMAGDVFGNGMLRSHTMQLVGAFNHAHIFVDPNPDAAASFTERQRLFNLPRSSWEDYDQALISSGGGIFPRTQKSIPVSTEVATRFEIATATVTPDELIGFLLKAKVDLLWNGGIGTYVKAVNESHLQVGDRANDNLRVNADQLRVRVVGEGGNLGLTHAGRIEYAQLGGAINADFIDNSGGVDCSDHEVNAKILLASSVFAGLLSPDERNLRLMDQAEAVAELVLDNNYVQARCLSLATRHAFSRTEEYGRLADRLEKSLGFNRREAAFPSAEILSERVRAGQGLTQPELATLLGYAKILLKSQLLDSNVLKDPIISAIAAQEFPSTLVAINPQALYQHRLLPSLVATQLANEIIGLGGITFVNRIMEFVGCSAEEVVKGYWISSRLLDLRARFDAIDHSSLTPATKSDLLLELIRLMRRMTRWLIREYRSSLDVGALLKRFEAAFASTLALEPRAWFSAPAIRRNDISVEDLKAAGMSTEEAQRHSAGMNLFNALAISELCARSGSNPTDAGPCYINIGALLQLDPLVEYLIGLEAIGHWHAMERDALLDDLCERQLHIAQQVLASKTAPEDWCAANDEFFQRWNAILGDLNIETIQELASISMTVRKLMDLARSGGY